MIRVVVFILSILTGVVWGLSFYSNIVLVDHVELIYYKISLKSYSSLWRSLFAIGGAWVAISLVMFLKKNKEVNYSDWLNKIAIAIWPVWFLCPFLFYKTTFWSIFSFVGITGLSVSRLFGNFEFSLDRWDERKNLQILGVLCSGITAYEVWFQYEFWRRLITGYSDWGIYVTLVMNTLKGKFFYYNLFDTNFLGDHFVPGMFVFLIPLVSLFKSELGIFIIQFFFVNLSCFILYAISRTNNLSVFQSIVIATAFLFLPSTSSMCLGYTYGFHGIIFVVPLILFFFLFYDKKCYKTALVFWTLSLLIKETVCVFFIGIGIVLILKKQNKFGWGVLLVSFLYGLVVTQFVMPYFSQTDTCRSVSRFLHLGNTTTEVLLSPYFRPNVFLNQLLQTRNVFFCLLLILPFIVFVLMDPIWLIAGIPLLGGVLMTMDSHLSTSIYTWYQPELVVLVFYMAIKGSASFRLNYTKTTWLKMFFTPCSLLKNSDSLMNSLFVGFFTMVILFFYLFSFSSHFGKNLIVANNWIDSPYPDYMERILSFIPSGSSITATDRLAGQFVFRNDIFFRKQEPQDYVIIDLFNIYKYSDKKKKDWETLRKKVIESGDFSLKWRNYLPGCCILLFQKDGKGQIPNMLKSIKEEEFHKEGDVCFENHNICIRYKWIKMNQVIILTLACRILDTPNCDLMVKFEYVDEKNKERALLFPFGEGINPAYLAQNDDTFLVRIGMKRECAFKVTVENFSTVDVAK